MFWAERKVNARDTGVRVMVAGLEAASSLGVRAGRYPESSCWLASKNRKKKKKKFETGKVQKRFTFWF